jgi:TolB protein
MPEPRLAGLARRLCLPAAATAAAVLSAAPALAADPPGAQTVLLSRTPAGALAGGEAHNPVISQDKRFARVVAFDSTAGDIAPGAQAGTSNVFAVVRAQPYGDNGTPWAYGQAILVSRGLNGQPANGPSTAPAIDGSSRTAPSCIAFVSAASNLVPGDTNGVADAFVASLRTGKITRVSVNARGQQANGPTTQVAVDGRCTRVAFVSTATNLALTRTSKASWKSARTTAGPRGARQVYIRPIGGSNALDRALRGLTFLASARAARAGDGHSFDPVFSSRGLSLAFTSLASNLGGGPPRGVSQVYVRTVARHRRAVAGGRRVQDMRLSTQLVSAANGRAGNGPSGDPAINAAGDTFAYQTRATNLLAGNASGVAQIIRTRVAGAAREHAWMSARGGRLGDQPSRGATMTDGGEWVFFTTDARSLRSGGDATPGSEVLFNAFPWIVSTGLDERPVAGAEHPDTSPHGNYVVFESGGVVLLRYLGPK